MSRPELRSRPVLGLACADASGHRAGPALSARPALSLAGRPVADRARLDQAEATPVSAPAPVSPAPVSTAARLPADTAPVHDARALTGGGQEARIVLDGAVYTLRVTRQRKLILTK
ncbi:Hemin uptake protein HemP [Albimonas donghaensis]|uniref:Hemin uptake protein HemP n=1 Tax=Albimonas donghaensis TaxID=356660 RepID=A0A1H3CHU8_9RHOB|nr:Hemin uptake protein HemP [Albimonas donghaensis]